MGRSAGFSTVKRLSLALLASGAAVASPGLAHAVRLLSFYDATTEHKAALGDWQMRIERNRFSGEILCRLRARDHRIVYRAHALGFRFGKHLDTASATYRLDQGPVARWRDALPELVRAGTPIDGPSLDTPTGGIVWLPVKSVGDANSITIQPVPNRRPRVFHLRGFAGMLEIAQARGCVPDARFVR